MSLKSTLFAIAMVMVLLLPVGRILRDQNPRTCFAFTLDEGYFAQVANQWAEGKGFRPPGGQPFDPAITVGIPMAWGASSISAWTDEDIAFSGRIFTFTCFILLLMTLGRSAYKVDRNWFAVPLALGIFGYGLGKIAFGPYFAFGFLGEMTGFLFAAYAYRTLDEKRFFFAGLFAVAVFAMKPTFVLFLPAVALAAAFHSRRAALSTGFAMAGGLGALVYGISNARNQTILNYLTFFFEESTKISRSAHPGSPVDLYAGINTAPAFYSLFFLVVGGVTAVRAFRVAPSQVAAFLFFLGGAIYFIMIGQRPIEKQWSAIFCLALVGFAAPWASVIANRFTGWISREYARGLVLAVSLTAVATVAHDIHHRFKHAPETACSSKEQSTINAKLRKLVDEGKVTKENLGGYVTDRAYDQTLYRLPFQTAYKTDWRSFGPVLPKYLYGLTKDLFPSPTGCTVEFRGDTFSLIRCEEKKESKTAPARKRS